MDTRHETDSAVAWRAFEVLGAARKLVVQAAKAVSAAPTPEALADLKIAIRAEELAALDFEAAARRKAEGDWQTHAA